MQEFLDCRLQIKCRLNESACNSKQKWNHDESLWECKELDDQVSCKNDYMLNPSTCGCECNKACKIDENLDIKNCSCEKLMFGVLALACENEILNTTETSLDDKKVIFEKSNWLIYTISMVITCLLLLVVIFISCYFYYANDLTKNNTHCLINIYKEQFKRNLY